jgi:hypothetical protein
MKQFVKWKETILETLTLISTDKQIKFYSKRLALILEKKIIIFIDLIFQIGNLDFCLCVLTF